MEWRRVKPARGRKSTPPGAKGVVELSPIAFITEPGPGTASKNLPGRQEFLSLWHADSLVRNLPGFARFLLVEAKAKTVLNSKDFAGLRAIQGLAGVKRRLIVYLGDRPQRTEDGIDVLPLRGFLAALEQHRLW